MKAYEAEPTVKGALPAILTTASNAGSTPFGSGYLFSHNIGIPWRPGHPSGSKQFIYQLSDGCVKEINAIEEKLEQPSA